MTTVEELVRDVAVSGAPAWYLLMPGNAGDTIISVGFFDLASRNGLRVTATTKESEIPAGSVVFVNGGGYLVPEWDGTAAQARIENVANEASRLVMLPCSIQGFEEFLANLPRHTDLFLREQYSYDHAIEHVPEGVRCHVDDDTAFHLDVARVLQTPLPSGFIRSLETKDRVRYALYWLLRARGRVQKTLRAFRADPESARDPGPLTVLGDISLLANFGGATEEECRVSAMLFAKGIEAYGKVITDRLHTAVMAALLGKEVVMIEGSYYKLRGVYEFSMSENAHVTFQSHA